MQNICLKTWTEEKWKKHLKGINNRIEEILIEIVVDGKHGLIVNSDVVQENIEM